MELYLKVAAIMTRNVDAGIKDRELRKLFGEANAMEAEALRITQETLVELERDLARDEKVMADVGIANPNAR